ncbi:MAG: TfoX/Sxy family protein [Gammaproteobacteria bacterium]|nr:TfoX/Sxy family protein [Gammaproteobacteria bacterium]MYE29941.1 TfoX/Sxy family protein [Gammaproteobacteria bacterium]MYI02100.1 TfoX/Sxy family protein [Gammaproteobacteria bacterium]
MSDKLLIDRIRQFLSLRKGYSERSMFGTVCFMINGNMCASVWQESLIVRLGKNGYDKVLTEPHVKPADMNGRIMKEWVLVNSAGIKSDENLAKWLERATEFSGSLPPK